MREEQNMNPEDQMLKDLFRQGEKTPQAFLKEQIMASIEPKSTFEYQPVISKRAWWFIGSGFISLMVYLLFGYKNEAGKPYFQVELPSMDFNRLNQWSNDFTQAFDGLSFQLPEVPFSLLAALSALIIIGVSFMISYQTRLFHSSH